MKLWSALTKRTQAKYRKDGVTPQRYNAWNRTTAKTKKRLASQGITRDEFLKAPNTRTVQLDSFRRTAIARLIRLLPRANDETIRAFVAIMTPAQLQIALKGRIERVRHLASFQKTAEGRPGSPDFQYYPPERDTVNPFWYH